MYIIIMKQAIKLVTLDSGIAYQSSWDGVPPGIPTVLLLMYLGGSTRWLKYVGSCDPHERPGWNA